MLLLNLVKIIILPYFLEHRLKVILSILGVALGVAVFISVRTASYSSKQAMKNFIYSISPQIDLQITYDRNGFDESFYPRICKVKGVELALPVISTRTRMIKTSLEGSKISIPLLILGLDATKRTKIAQEAFSEIDIGKFLSQPNQVVVTEGFLEEHNLKVKSSLTLITARGERSFKIASYIKKGESPYSKNNNLMIIDFFAAQYHFQKENKIDRVDIKVKKGFDINNVKKDLIKELGSELKIRTPDERVNRSDQLYNSFILNLTVVSLISLLVGMYLIYNTINTSILQQRKEIGILRALGVTKRNILIIFSLKGMIIGLIGSILGLIFGWVLAYFSVAAFTQKITRHYLSQNLQQVQFDPILMVIGFAVGLGIAFLSSFFPSLAAVRITPIETIRSVSYENIKKVKVNRYSIIGLIILVFAYISSQMNPIYNIPVFGFLSNLLIILGFSFLAPLIIKLLIQGIRPFLLRVFKIEMALASENLTRALGRNSITISTLMISIALIVSIATLIQSYHYSVGHWFEQVNNAPFSITSGSAYSKGDPFPMKANRIDSIRNHPELQAMIQDIDDYRFYTTSFKGNRLDIHSFKLDVARKYTQYTFMQGEGKQDSAFEVMTNDEGVLISENIASQYSLGKGDIIRLKTKLGDHDFKIAGVVINYLSSKGIVSINQSVFQKYWDDFKIDIFKIYLKKDTNIKDFRDILYKTIDHPENLIFTSLDEFKEEVFQAIDETFSMFHALEFITVLIAIMGVINALLTSILERKREIGILRSIGATKKQIGKIILLEAGLIGLIGALLGIVGGIFLSLVTVFVINKQTVGWYLEYSLPIELLGYLIIGSIVIATLSGYYPSKKACNIVIRDALEYE